MTRKAKTLCIAVLAVVSFSVNVLWVIQKKRDIEMEAANSAAKQGYDKAIQDLASVVQSKGHVSIDIKDEKGQTQTITLSLDKVKK